MHPNHSRGSAGEKFVEGVLPGHWVVRKVVPDYGLDLHIEVFDLLQDGSGWAQTAGEHIYAQVKTDSEVSRYDAIVGPRLNVSKFKSVERRGDDDRRVGVVSVPIDVAELATIEAMGSSVPVILFWVDVELHAAYYVCMNDYISKVLLVENPRYAEQQTVSIRIPALNRIDAETTDFTYFWLLARRSKLYSLFNLFNYQFHELDFIRNRHPSRADISASQALEMIDVFVSTNLRLDVWGRRGDGWWAPLEDIHGALTTLRRQMEEFKLIPTPQLEKRLMHYGWDTMRRGANLGRMYEEIVREWYLPTHLAASLR